ncbi:MAG: GPR endopeptidase [Candidatus Hydrogenedens sp.]|nr:GPR endopeptidase [Candidatus Hydrogenedens sp.]
MRQVRTDLAMERCGGGEERLPGVHVSAWETHGITITEVTVETEEGAKITEKPVGRYVTLEMPAGADDPDTRLAVAELLGEELMRMLPEEGEGPALVIGLGNRQVTPDSLGPKTVDGTLVTRHLFEELPEAVDERMTSVCALAPGVLGVTGVETMELARSVTQSVKPRVVVCVDSLAARSYRRVGSAIQLTDTGIQPGSGVGNHRTALTRETLGVPVIGLGVPTVIYAATIARDAFESLSDAGEEELEALSKELLGGEMSSLIVTPREIDKLVDDVADLLSGGINRAFHPGLSAMEIEQLQK